MQNEFWSSVDAEVLRRVCAAEAAGRYAAVVSELLFVLRQTAFCESLLEQGTFYSLEDVLSVRVCSELRAALRGHTDGMTEDRIGGEWYHISYFSCPEGLLLIFRAVSSPMPLLRAQARRLREVGGNLLHTAGEGGDAQSRSVRREAMRLLRQASHLAAVTGEEPAGDARFCTVRELLEQTAQRVSELTGVSVSVRCDVPDGAPILCFPELICGALYTLMGNSIRYGGAQVHIQLSASLEDGIYTLRVGDDGPGPGENARRWMLTGWADSNAPEREPAWGLGLPYAARIAELHGGRLVPVLRPEGFAVHLILSGLEEEQVLRAGLFEPDTAGEIDPALVELSELLAPERY